MILKLIFLFIIYYLIGFLFAYFGKTEATFIILTFILLGTVIMMDFLRFRIEVLEDLLKEKNEI